LRKPGHSRFENGALLHACSRPKNGVLLHAYSRPKNGVLLHAYVPGIHAFETMR
jgi:hypothetical protein